MSDWRDVLEQLVMARGKALFGYAYVLTGNRDEAEDLLQDALVRAFRSGRSAQSIDAAHVYVKRSIATAYIDRARRAAVRPKSVGGGEDLSAWLQSAARHDHAHVTELSLDLHTALLTLAPRERACIVLRYMEDMRVDDVAAALDIAPGTVKRYLADAIVQLRTALPGLEFGAEDTIDVSIAGGGR
jgi:RNA polymerase sigma-70 factor (ECF subfamily)